MCMIFLGDSQHFNALGQENDEVSQSLVCGEKTTFVESLNILPEKSAAQTFLIEHILVSYEPSWIILLC